MLIAGDIGGTKTDLAIYSTASGPSPSSVCALESAFPTSTITCGTRSRYLSGQTWPG
jgi:hypothetical protein